MIFSFFMVAAVSPAVAEGFDAEVSMITDFNEAVNLMPNTKNVDATPDDMDNTLELWDGRAVVSNTSRDVHVEVSEYGRTIRSNDVSLEYYNYKAGNILQLYSQIAPSGFRNASTTGCDFTMPTVYQESAVPIVWIRVIVRDQNGGNSVYSWVKTDYTNANIVGLSFSPNVLLWNDGLPLVTCNFVNITLFSATPLYFWWKDFDGTVQGESLELDVTTDITVFPEEGNFDPNFSILYQNAAYETSKLGKIDVTADTTYSPNFDTEKGLNILTGYDASYDGAWSEAYFLYLPKCKALDATNDPTGINNGKIFYKGIDIGFTKVADVSIDKNTYISLRLNINNLKTAENNDAKALQKNWSGGNSKVVYSQVIQEDKNDDDIEESIRYVAGPADGAGPRLLSASLSYDDASKLILAFSEDLNPSYINADKLNAELDIASGIRIDEAYIHPTDASKIIVITSNEIDEAVDTVNFNFNVDATSDAVRDLSGNSAYRLQSDLSISVERRVVNVEVSGVNITSGPDADGYFDGSTYIRVYFDKSMKNGDVSDDSSNKHPYFVEWKPGLEKDPNTGSTITGIDYKEEPVVGTADTFYAILTVKGVIAKTAEADLPGVKIIRDIEGGSPLAPVASEDRDVLIPSDDMVGPYLANASFNLNPTHGDTSTDLVKAEKATLTLTFSEEVYDEDLSNTSFLAVIAGGFATWDPAVLKDLAYVSPLPSSTVTLTLDNDAKPMDIPFEPGTGKFKIIFSDSTDDIKDEMGNCASFKYGIEILDATPVWISSSIVENNGNYLRITSKFGKQVSMHTDFQDYKKKLIKIDGDPNMPYHKSNYAPIKFTDRTTITVDVSVDKATDWKPKVTFNSSTVRPIHDYKMASTYTSNDLTKAFDVVAKDGVKPRLKLDKAGQIKGFETGTTGSGANLKHIVEIPIYFTEPLSPDNFANPVRASRYFKLDNDASYDYSIDTFVTSGQYASSGNRLTIRITTDADLTLDNGKYALQFGTTANYQIFDMNKNSYDTTTIPPLEFDIMPGVPTGVWSVPEDVDIDHGDNIPISPYYMKIKGFVYDPNGDPFKGGTNDAVYAYSQDRLFVVERDATTDEVVKVSYDVSHDRCYGAGMIQDDGSYYMNVYGGNESSFANGEPVILVVHDYQDGSTTDISTDRVCTTACLANAEYSVVFEGRYVPKLVEKNLYLNKREEIKVKPGWNLISTSIGSAYVDPAVCADTQLDPSSFKGYMYGPDDALTGAGSLPSNVYNLSNGGHRDSSALLFTISEPNLKNSIFAPYSPYSIPDLLNDSLNDLPVFGPGLAFYVYIDNSDVINKDSDWNIVLFGDKVPSPEYKLRVTSSQTLVGHWGNLLYYTNSGDTLSSNLKAGTELPSTYTKDQRQYVDDVCLGEGSNPISTMFAITVTDSAGTELEVDSVSTFYNYTTANKTGPGVWWGADNLIDYSDLVVVAPGGGAWIKVVGDDSGGPYFINYMNEIVD